MIRILALVATGLLLAATGATAGDYRHPDSLPSAQVPNPSGSLTLPPSWTTGASKPYALDRDQLQLLWQGAGSAYQIPWPVLASINKIESNFGRNMGPSSAGAIGWMQFMPSTWLRWGLDADADGIADPWDPYDAVYAAARYLAAAHGSVDIRRAVYAYNHADWYVREVLDLAKVYDTGGEAIAFSLDQVQVDLSAAQAAVAQASSQLLGAHRKVAKLQRREARLVRLAQAARLLSQRLDYADEAAAVSAALARANAKVATLQSQLDSAKGDLAAARQAATEAQSAGSSARSLLGGTVSASGYVFPVGGGPSVISVSHSHHDYPAADIAAPEGAPLYALEDGVVTNAWSGIDARCGIGFTFRGSDGKTWTYCHMSYREPGVVSGVQLRAGQPVGLVGHTGHATGPHLHLQLQPAVEWPQREDWFSAFAGSAFRWQDAPTPGLDEDDGPSIDFTPAFDLATRSDSGNAFSAPAPEVAPPPAPTETVPSFGDRDPQNPFATG